MQIRKVSTIIVLNDYCHVQGGASRVAVDEAVALARQGLEVIFLGAVGPICAELQAAPLRVVCLGQPELLEVGRKPAVIMQGLWNRAAGRALREILQGCNPRTTIVHLHGYTKALTTSPVRVATQAGFQVVCTLHDFYTACPNGAFFDFQSRSVCHKRGLSFDCLGTNCDKRHYAHKLYRFARGLVQKYCGRLPAAVRHYITLSENSAQVLRPYLPKTAQFYPLENISAVAPSPAVPVAANQELVVVGRLDVEKGIETVLAAAQQAGMGITFVGDGPLRAAVAAVPDCRVTGWVTAAAVQDALSRARCLIFPSLWYEAYGLVVTEAAARGIPAIVTNVCAAAERVTDGVEGWVVPAGDSAALAEALRQTRDDATIAAAGAAAYRRFWDNPPTHERHNAGLLAIYEAVLSHANA